MLERERRHLPRTVAPEIVRRERAAHGSEISRHRLHDLAVVKIAAAHARKARERRRQARLLEQTARRWRFRSAQERIAETRLQRELGELTVSCRVLACGYHDAAVCIVDRVCKQSLKWQPSAPLP